jgi:ubiquinone/menaquinone biosynthesis C-methylase UbiE
MREFHPNEQCVPVPLDGQADKIMLRRSAIKLSEGARIVVAIPIGGKPLHSVLECPTCRDSAGHPVKYQIDDGFIAQGYVPMEFMLQHMNWLPPLNATIAYMFKTGMLSGAARQVMTQEALRMPTAKYIFYVDDDMVIPAMGLYTLYNHMEQNPELGALSGVYTTRQNPPEPLVYLEHGSGAAWDMELGEGAIPAPIMGAGAGCLLARTDAIRAWQDANPGEAIWCDSHEFPAYNGQRINWGHDIRFCRNLTEAGWPVYVDGRVLCGHYDARTKTVFSVPPEAPGFDKVRNRQLNINTKEYWDQVYSQEGADTWRKYPELFEAVAFEVSPGDRVLELGCGVGILGSKLTAEKQVRWRGYDISPSAVEMCKSRFLEASVADVRNSALLLEDADVLIGCAILEHLNRDDAVALLQRVQASDIRKVIYTTPNNCMGPSEVAEHTALFNQEHIEGLHKEALGEDFAKWQYNVISADAHHLIWVMWR